ncbi:uncharacterized protein F4822DRAFT_234440 [Hypoxylon trugodes]|uniref:uncharacterized protein n=1 Tax=Hypoxylon trugodes TaxID=326681 RepID=UPI002193EAE6|nr:uncharacterized protein F4822DRAFT_234440 [Hypoxylon trugodes]KAI1390374.1 hypothetical protein F4822DRAFT_234440 [Hypoxylon trugodes]
MNYSNKIDGRKIRELRKAFLANKVADDDEKLLRSSTQYCQSLLETLTSDEVQYVIGRTFMSPEIRSMLRDENDRMHSCTKKLSNAEERASSSVSMSSEHLSESYYATSADSGSEELFVRQDPKSAEFNKRERKSKRKRSEFPTFASLAGPSESAPRSIPGNKTRKKHWCDSRLELMDDDHDSDDAPLSKSIVHCLPDTGKVWDYRIWTSSSGQTSGTFGALIPEGYKEHDDLSRPWICPVRSCRTLFPTLRGLGGHFNSGHRAMIFNDNQDGTLSFIDTREGITSKTPAKVVSKRPLDPKEPPMREPTIPERRSRQSEISRPTCNSQLAEIPEGETRKALWKYIQSQLQHNPPDPIPRDKRVRMLLKSLTRVRNIEFNPQTKYSFNESKNQDIPAMIVQVTGKEAKHPCRRCKEGKGPFLGCYILPGTAPLDAQQSILGCANCYYKGSQYLCDFMKRSGDLDKDLESNVGLPPTTKETPSITPGWVHDKESDAVDGMNRSNPSVVILD